MSRKNKTKHLTPGITWKKPVFTSAGIGLIIIVLFLITAGDPDPVWPEFWRIRPLVIVPLAGAMGGLSYSIMYQLWSRKGWSKIWVNLIGILVIIIGLYLGIVLGLDGTYWN